MKERRKETEKKDSTTTSAHLLCLDRQKALDTVRREMEDVSWVKKCLEDISPVRQYLMKYYRTGRFHIVDAIECHTGNINVVFIYAFNRSRDLGKPLELCVKRYLPFPKRDPNYSFPPCLLARGVNEWRYYKIFHRLLRGTHGVRILKPIYYDKGMDWLILPAIKEERLYLDCMTDEKVGLQAARNLASLLARIQNTTYGVKPSLSGVDTFKQRLQYRCHIASKSITESVLQEYLRDFQDNSTRSDRCVVHNSFSPKNVFVDEHGCVSLFDFEFSTLGDPAADVGYMLGHLLLCMLTNPAQEDEYRKIMKVFVTEYERNICGRLKRDYSHSIVPRIVKYIGLVLLYRAGQVDHNREVQNQQNTELLISKGKDIFKRNWYDLNLYFALK